MRERIKAAHAACIELRIPIRGYEIAIAEYIYTQHGVTNPYKGL